MSRRPGLTLITNRDASHYTKVNSDHQQETTMIARRLFSRFIILTTALLASLAGHAQSFPSKPITIKVAYPAGGPADVAIRDYTPALAQQLGQPALIENVGGANGSIAAMSVLRATPDGHTLLGIVASDLILAPKVVPAAKFKPDEFRAIAITQQSELVLISSPKHDFKDVDDVVRYLKSNPGKGLSIGHWGNGSITHVAGADFAKKAGIELLQVPYKGAAPVLPDLTSGIIDLTFYPLAGPLLGQIKAGYVRPIAIAADTRNPQLPQVPTVNESKAVRGFTYTIWSGVFASKQIPDVTIARLNKALSATTATSEWRARQVTVGATLIEPRDVKQTESFFNAEIKKMEAASRVVRFEPN